MAVTSEQLIDALRPVTDPELHRSIVDLGMVRRVAVNDGVADVVIALTIAGCPLRNEITTRVTDALVALDGVERVALDFTVMTPDELDAVRRLMQAGGGHDHSHAGHSHAGHSHAGPSHGPGGQPGGPGPQGHAAGRPVPFNQPGSRTRPLLISSGKGGVGKSSVTANLAVALAARGHSVGVVDADIYGYSIPRMLGATDEPEPDGEQLLPPSAWGVKVMSIGYFVPEGQAVIWRGPMLHKALEQFLSDVRWDDPEFLLVDMPPGTGDIAISLAQYLPRGEVFVVTTPQAAAQKVARLSAAMAAKVNLNVAGVIENMSWFTGDDGKRYELFGSGGGAELATELGVPLLAQIPLVPELRAGGDSGLPIAAIAPDSESGQIFHRLAEQIAVDLRPRRVFTDALRVQ